MEGEHQSPSNNAPKDVVQAGPLGKRVSFFGLKCEREQERDCRILGIVDQKLPCVFCRGHGDSGWKHGSRIKTSRWKRAGALSVACVILLFIVWKMDLLRRSWIVLLCGEW